MYNLIVDFEATCCKNNEFPRHEMEIIEFGAVITFNGNNFASFSRFVKPKIHKTLTDFCKNLTTITQLDVDNADSFELVFDEFKDWIDSNIGDNSYTFYSWGDFDKNILIRDCINNNRNCSTIVINHKNAKQLFADKFNTRPMGVGKALKFKNMKFDGTPHRAISDAINIAKLVNLV